MDNVVYLVLVGTNPGRRIIGAYDEERADLIASTLSGTVEVRRLTLNIPWHERIEDGLAFWEVAVEHDGSVHYVSKSDSWIYVEYSPFIAADLCLYVWVWARDKEHAIDLVNEMREYLITSGEWDRLAVADDGVILEEESDE